MKKKWVKTPDDKWFTFDEAIELGIDAFKVYEEPEKDFFIEKKDGRYYDIAYVFSPTGFNEVERLANEEEKKALDKAREILLKYRYEIAPELPPFDLVRIIDEEEYNRRLSKMTISGNLSRKKHGVSGKEFIVEFEKMAHEGIISIKDTKSLCKYVSARFHKEDGDGLSVHTLLSHLGLK